MAELLVHHSGYTRLRFAEPLKRMLQVVGLSLAETDGDLKEKPCALLLGRTPRHAMQTLGTEWGRQCIGQELWTSLWLGLAKQELAQGRSIVVDDLRFLNEAVAVRALGGRIWRIVRPGTEARFSHVSETELSRIAFDLRFLNDGKVSDLHKLISKVISHEQR